MDRTTGRRSAPGGCGPAPARPGVFSPPRISCTLRAMTDATDARRKLEAWSPWIVLVAALLLWELLCRGLKVSEFVFPAPSAIAAALWEYAGLVSRHALQTFWTTMAGFALGVGVGLLLGFVIGSSRLMY